MLWIAAAETRQKYQQPPECYLTDFYGGSAFVDAIDMSGSDADMEMVRSLDALETVRLILPLTTLACWRMTQGIYRIDPAVYAALIETPLTGDIPADVLLRLPEWCVYVETPGLQVIKRDGSGMADLVGVFARIDVENNGQRNLVLTLDMPEACGLEAQSIPLIGQIDAALENAMGIWQAVDQQIIAAIKGYAVPIINLLLYVCSSVNDIDGKRGQPGNPAPTKTRRGGWRLFAADGPRTWDVGVRMGAALRAAYQAAETESVGPALRYGPRGHVRRAHWHGFRSGPRKRDDGSDIPAELRRFDLRWLPPIPVNLPDIAELPATIRRIT
jgi:hypothetical protein